MNSIPESAASILSRPSPNLTVFCGPRMAPAPDDLDALQRIAGLPDVLRVAALPDLHIKPHLETPSSTATATSQVIILSLSSPSPGCGMALALTPLGVDDLSPARLQAFFACLAEHLPLERSGSPSPATDFIRSVLLHGAAPAIERYELDPRSLAAIEVGGNALKWLDSHLDLGHPASKDHSAQVLAAIPNQFLPLAQREFGSIGRGNHFFELQVVEELLDVRLAAHWGLQAGQVAAMYHADSGRLGALLGRWYAFRRKNTWRGRWLELRYKTAFHLSQAASLHEVGSRAEYYFAPRRHTPLPAASPLAHQALLALWAATNYAFANRVAILAALRDALRQVFSPLSADPHLLYDLTHNSIHPEQINAEWLWLHRHNANPAYPTGHPALLGGPFATTGQPLFLPGTHRTSAYICVAGPNAADSLYSVDHGAGSAALRLGKALPAPALTTQLYDYHRGYIGEHSHLSDDGPQEVLASLNQAGLVRPVARLRPLAVLKDVFR